jgi:RNA polymerase sigma factor (sigma-70 family)
MRSDWRRRRDGELLGSSDPDAFRELYIRHERLVVTFIAARLRDAELTADLTAETFAAAMLAADRFRDDGSPAAGWLLGIARNLIGRHFERRNIETRARDRLAMERLEITDASLERIEALIDARHPDNPMLALLDELPPVQRDAVRAHVLDERTYAAMASERGVTEAAIRQRASRGLKRLRLTLEEKPR